MLHCVDPEKFFSLAQYFNFAHVLLEDGMQVVLYSIVASGNASSGAEDNIEQVILAGGAAMQSLISLLVKAYELLRDPVEVGLA